LVGCDRSSDVDPEGWTVGWLAGWADELELVEDEQAAAVSTSVLASALQPKPLR
jgi:hypothetical protein